MDHSERAQEQQAARHHATPPARTADLRGPEQLLLALQAHAGNRAVQRIVAGSGPPRTPVVQRVTGLAADVGGFVGDLSGVFEQWTAPGATLETRKKALAAVINNKLDQLKVPKISLLPGLTGTGGSVHGNFKPNVWIMDISTDLLNQLALDVTQRAELADTVIHESRHAEQFFRVARLLCVRERESDAGKKKSARRDSKTIAAAVAARLDMNVSVVTDAQQQGGELSHEEATEAASWSQSIPLNAAVHAELKKKKQAWQLWRQDFVKYQQDWKSAPKRGDMPDTPVEVDLFRDRLKALKARCELTFAQYRQAYRLYQAGLTFEADAWQTGQAAHTAVAGTNPPDLDTKLAGLRASSDAIFLYCETQLYTAPPLPYRDPLPVQPLQMVQRHAIPPELEQLPEGIEPIT
ncbi:hypothetical protein ACFVYA_26970 [Amycolatopsis sp. NPDC058278]|uniref:hypothetical protein n=1 Tax=Amycolatopsis sp. NPDC058278 TaxID=3346417 RepID=UPI0036DB405F